MEMFCRRKRQATAPSSPVTRSGRVRRSTAGLLAEPGHSKPGSSHEVALHSHVHVLSIYNVMCVASHVSCQPVVGGVGLRTD